MITIYERAVELIRPGQTIGLGSGRASTEFIRLLGKKVQEGLNVRGVPTSIDSEQEAQRCGIPLVSLAEGIPLALTVDGADEVAPNLDLIKGYGRALIREKIVASASEKLVILVGPGKQVPLLGSRGKLPVEVTPFALPLCLHRLNELGLDPVLYQQEGKEFVTDNGNHILDCAVGPIADPRILEQQIHSIPGVLGTGLFLGMADVVLLGDESFRLVRELQRTDLERDDS